MKRTTACVLIAVFFCLALCGCGNRETGLDDMVVGTPVIPEASPEVSPMISPMITPDVEDGIVEDTDGLIEDNDTGRDQTADTARTPNGTAASPTPQVTSAP